MIGIFRNFFEKAVYFIVLCILLGALIAFGRTIIVSPSLLIAVFYLIYFILGFLGYYILMIKQKNNRFIPRLVYIVLTGLFIRIIAVYYLGIEQQGDYGIYLSAALKLFRGMDINKQYYSIFPHALHYPIFISFLYKIVGFSTFVTKGIHLFFSIIESVFIFLILEKLAGKKLSGWGSLLLVLCPSSILFVVFTGGESIYSSFIIIALYITVLLYDGHGKRSLKKTIILSILLGVIIGIADFFRPTAVILIIALVIEEVLFCKEKWKYKILRITTVILLYILLTGIFKSITTNITQYANPSKSFGWNLYVGGNYETYGRWDVKDGETFKQAMETYKNPSDLQEFFCNHGIERYKEMIISGKIIEHFVRKLLIWVDETKLATRITEWQTPNSRYIIKGAFHIIEWICFSFQIVMFFGMLIFATYSKVFKDRNATTRIILLYIIGSIILYLILETASRYKGAYYSVIALLTVILSINIFKNTMNIKRIPFINTKKNS